MEENNLQAQPPIVTEPKPTRPWLKIALLVVLGVILVGGLVFAGIQLGRKQAQLPAYPTPASRTIVTPTPVAVIPTKIPVTTSKPLSTPTPDPTANWKTYTNSTLGIELKYPNPWTTKSFSISTSYPLHAIVELVSDIKPENTKWPSIQIRYWENPENLALAQLEQKYTSTESGLGPKIYQPGGEWIKVAGVDAYRVRQGDCEPYYCDKVSIPYKQNVFVLQNYLVISEDTYNQILSTFRFLPSTDSGLE